MPGWVELHCHSNSSFLDGASDVGDLVDAAADAGMDALALTDTNGLYGAVRFANAAKERGLKPLYGAELHLLDAGHLVVIARDRQGWTSLCRIISAAQLAGEKTKPRATFALVRENAAGLFVLTGCAHGAVPRLFRGVPIGAKATHVWLAVPRVECSACGVTRQVAASAGPSGGRLRPGPRCTGRGRSPAARPARRSRSDAAPAPARASP